MVKLWCYINKKFQKWILLGLADLTSLTKFLSGNTCNHCCIKEYKEIRFHAHPDVWNKKEHEQVHEVIVEDPSLFH